MHGSCSWRCRYLPPLPLPLVLLLLLLLLLAMARLLGLLLESTCASSPPSLSCCSIVVEAATAAGRWPSQHGVSRPQQQRKGVRTAE